MALIASAAAALQRREELIAVLVAAIAGLPAVLAVSAGDRFTCGLRGSAAAGGTLYCWGVNNVGQVDGTGANASTPLDVGGGKVWKQVSAGPGGHFCAIDDSDKLFCQGANDVGQLGRGTKTLREPLGPVGTASSV